MLHMMAWWWLPWWCCCSPSVICVYMFLFSCLYALFDINLLWWHDDDGTMIVFLFAPGQFVFIFICIIWYKYHMMAWCWWLPWWSCCSPPGHFGEALSRPSLCKEPAPKILSSRFCFGAKECLKGSQPKKKIITIAYISSPFDPLIVWLAQISHFPGWN